MPVLLLTGPSNPLRSTNAEVRRAVGWMPVQIESGTGKGGASAYMKQCPGLRPLTLDATVLELTPDFSSAHVWPAMKSSIGFTINAKSSADITANVSKLDEVGVCFVNFNCEFDQWFKWGSADPNPFINGTYSGGRLVTMTTTPTATATSLVSALNAKGIAVAIQLTGSAPEYQPSVTYEPRRHPAPTNLASHITKMASWAGSASWPAPITWHMWNEGGRTIYDCDEGVDLNNNPITETESEYYTRRMGLKDDAVTELTSLYTGVFASLPSYHQASAPVMIAGDTRTSRGRSTSAGLTLRAAWWDALDAAGTYEPVYAPHNDYAGRDDQILSDVGDFNGHDAAVFFTQSAPALLKSEDEDSTPAASTIMGPVCQRLSQMASDLALPEVAVRCQSYFAGNSNAFLATGTYTEQHAFTALRLWSQVPTRRVNMGGVAASPSGAPESYGAQGMVGIAGVDPGGQTAAVLIWNEGAEAQKVTISTTALPTGLLSGTTSLTVLDEDHPTGVGVTWAGGQYTLGARSVALFKWSAATSPEARRNPLADGTYTPVFLRRIDNYDRPKRSSGYFDQVRGVGYLFPVLERAPAIYTGCAYKSLPDSIWVTTYAFDVEHGSKYFRVEVDYTGSGTYTTLLDTTLDAIKDGAVNQVNLLASAPGGWSAGTRQADIRVKTDGAHACRVEFWLSGTPAKANAVKGL